MYHTRRAELPPQYKPRTPPPDPPDLPRALNPSIPISELTESDFLELDKPLEPAWDPLSRLDGEESVEKRVVQSGKFGPSRISLLP